MLNDWDLFSYLLFFSGTQAGIFTFPVSQLTRIFSTRLLFGFMITRCTFAPLSRRGTLKLWRAPKEPCT